MWQYFLVFLGSFLVDIIPFPGPPAWTVMVLLQVSYGLNVWWVLIFGVIGSVIGRYGMSLYFGKLAERFLNPLKNEDLKFLGDQLSKSMIRSWLFVFLYTLIPLPTTPLFNVAGMARVRAGIIVPPFLVGKFISDAFMVIASKYAAENINDLMESLLTWKSLLSLFIGLLILCAILFIDWWTLIRFKRLKLKFDIWK